MLVSVNRFVHDFYVGQGNGKSEGRETGETWNIINDGHAHIQSLLWILWFNMWSHHRQLVKSYQSVSVNGCDDEHFWDFIKSGFEEIFIPPEGFPIVNRTLLIKSELIILSVAICRLFVDFSCSNFFLEAVFCSSNSSRWVLGFFSKSSFFVRNLFKKSNESARKAGGSWSERRTQITDSILSGPKIKKNLLKRSNFEEKSAIDMIGTHSGK